MLVLKGLTLREVRREDLPEVARSFNVRELAVLAQPTAPVPVPLSVFERRFEAGIGAISSGEPGDIEFVVTRTGDESSRALGVAGLYGISWIHGFAEIGVSISADDGRGDGLGIDCYVALADYAFHDLGLNRVSGCVKASNERARGTLTRIGLVEESVQRQARFLDGRYEDLHTVSMLASEWDPALLDWRKLIGSAADQEG